MQPIPDDWAIGAERRAALLRRKPACCDDVKVWPPWIGGRVCHGRSARLGEPQSGYAATGAAHRAAIACKLSGFRWV